MFIREFRVHIYSILVGFFMFSLVSHLPIFSTPFTLLSTNTQYIHINKSIFATKRLSVNKWGTLCQGENCLITMFNLVIYYCYTATNFLLTCTIIFLLIRLLLSNIPEKISRLYFCSDLYFYYSSFGTGLKFGILEQVGSSHILICFLLLYPKENSTTILALNSK